MVACAGGEAAADTIQPAWRLIGPFPPAETRLTGRRNAEPVVWIEVARRRPRNPDRSKPSRAVDKPSRAVAAYRPSMPTPR